MTEETLTKIMRYTTKLTEDVEIDSIFKGKRTLFNNAKLFFENLYSCA